MEVRLVRIEFGGAELKAVWGRTGLAPNYKLLIETATPGSTTSGSLPGRASRFTPTMTASWFVCPGRNCGTFCRMGHTEDSSLKTGDCLWRLGQTHVGRNIGQTDLWVIAVEPK